jgi:chromate transporter
MARRVNDPLLRLSLLFLQMSLLAFGGANTILPELQRQVVDVNYMMTAHTFAALFALAQAAPGPNMMVISLIGWHVAGLSGAVLTMACAVAPSSVLTFLVARAWYRFRDAPWRRAIQIGLLPVTAGLLLSSAALLIKATTLDWSLGLLTLAVTVLLLMTRVHPMLMLGGCGGAGSSGSSRIAGTTELVSD